MRLILTATSRGNYIYIYDFLPYKAFPVMTKFVMLDSLSLKNNTNLHLKLLIICLKKQINVV